MVDTQFIPAVRRQLEKFLIEKNEFQLRGQTYDLILLVPSDRYSMDTKYSLFISCKLLGRSHNSYTNAQINKIENEFARYI